MGFRALIICIASAAALGFSSNAFAGGGNYTIVGGTPYEQQQVDSALGASAFNWSLVPGPVTITILPGVGNSNSVPGQIRLDAGLLDSGAFSWGVVQMEYAQQVQFSLVTLQMRTQLTTLLGAQQWCYDDPALPRGASACERFAATLAWAYWPSAQNCMRPTGSSDWSASVDPSAFRALLHQLIAAPNPEPAPTPRVLAAEHTIVQTARRADGSVQLLLSVPRAGMVTVTGKGVVRTSVSTAASGGTHVWLQPSKPLELGSSRTIRVQVTFVPVGGSAVTAKQSVTFSRMPALLPRSTRP